VGEGAADWQIPNTDGTYNPPPHDDSGHTWHHPDQLLIEMIAVGGQLPQTRMPGFGDQLTDEQIVGVVEFIKTWWGPEERAFQLEMTLRAANE
jgi:mono/diheme cytochrome c family protein